MRWNSKPEDEIQWVAGFYSFLDYGDRFDQFKTGPEGLFNQGAAIAVAVADGGLYTPASVANLQAARVGGYAGPDASKSLLYKTWSTATAQDYENWGTADLDLRIGKYLEKPLSLPCGKGFFEPRKGTWFASVNASR